MSYSLTELRMAGIEIDGEPKLAPLTHQQEAFCQAHVNEGMTKTAAYRHTYNVGEDTLPSTVNSLAWKLSCSPSVRARCELLRSGIGEGLSLDTARLRSISLSVLVEQAEHGSSESIRSKAAIAIAKMPGVGLYEKAKDEDDNTSGKDTVIELKAVVTKLKQRIETAEEKDPS